jgi:phage repressor protein C with HTH and peptisase S24 domain
MKARSIGDRLKTQRAQLGLSQEELSRASGVPVSTLKKYESNERVPGGDALAGLAKAGVNLAKLLIGREDSPGPALHVAQPAAGYVYLPLYDVRAAAGGGALVENEAVVDVLAFKESWIRQELHASPDDLRLIHVEGDSMEPDLRAGDIILIDHTDRGRREGVYVIRMDDALLVKQLQRLPGGIIRVISRNAAYEPFTVPSVDLDAPGGISVVGRVVWACRRL